MHGNRETKEIYKSSTSRKGETWLNHCKSERESYLVKTKLDNMTKSERMLNNGSNALDEILDIGKIDNDMKGIGFLLQLHEQRSKSSH